MRRAPLPGGWQPSPGFPPGGAAGAKHRVAQWAPVKLSPRIVVAPDSLKGTASSPDAARWLAAGIREALPDAEISLTPMADGGEGTAALLGGEAITLPTTTAAGRLTEATYFLDRESRTAHIDVAAASGLPQVEHSPVPLTGDTYGTGVLIADAQSRGARRIVLALGGSATLDGGTGILAALGAAPQAASGAPVPHGGGWLKAIEHIDTAQLNIPAAGVDWVLLADVTAPVTGENGAARGFGPQKGADDSDVELREESLAHLCRVLDVDPERPGFGAAGAIPVGIAWLSRLIYGDLGHVEVLPGAAAVAASQGLKEKIAGADLVVTAEGAVDAQSFRGKVVGAVADLAKEAGARLGVAAGRVPEGLLPSDALGETADTGVDVEEQLRHAGRRLGESYRSIATVQG